MPRLGPPVPAFPPAQLNHDQMKRGVERLRQLLKEVKLFDVSKVQKRNSPEVRAIEARIRGVLEAVFGTTTSQFRTYSPALHWDTGVHNIAGYWGDRPHDEVAETRKHVTEGKKQAEALLGEAIKLLLEEIAYSEPSTVIEAIQQERSNDVFIVHGHDVAAREAVSNFVKTLGLNAIVLQEQANRGATTVIEKFERHGSGAGFAVVLLTPDDEGRKFGGTDLSPRARQNVILELGYFIGKLGRENVCPLATSREMELPSDMGGVVAETFDNANSGWKVTLARELRAAGFKFDAGKLIE